MASSSRVLRVVGKTTAPSAAVAAAAADAPGRVLRGGLVRRAAAASASAANVFVADPRGAGRKRDTNTANDDSWHRRRDRGGRGSPYPSPPLPSGRHRRPFFSLSAPSSSIWSLWSYPSSQLTPSLPLRLQIMSTSAAVRCRREAMSRPYSAAAASGKASFSTSSSSSSSSDRPLPPDDDYDRRAAQFGMPTKEELRSVVMKASPEDDVVFLDVRSPPELEEVGTLRSREYVHCWCTMDDQTELRERAEELIPNKDATVVAFCAVGGRASKAKAALESMGYTNVYNGGGLKDLDYLDTKE